MTGGQRTAVDLRVMLRSWPEISFGPACGLARSACGYRRSSPVRPSPDGQACRRRQDIYEPRLHKARQAGTPIPLPSAAVARSNRSAPMNLGWVGCACLPWPRWRRALPLPRGWVNLRAAEPRRAVRRVQMPERRWSRQPGAVWLCRPPIRNIADQELEWIL